MCESPRENFREEAMGGDKCHKGVKGGSGRWAAGRSLMILLEQLAL